MHGWQEVSAESFESAVLSGMGLRVVAVTSGSPQAELRVALEEAARTHRHNATFFLIDARAAGETCGRFDLSEGDVALFEGGERVHKVDAATLSDVLERHMRTRAVLGDCSDGSCLLPP